METTFVVKLCYHAACEKKWLREEDRLGEFSRAQRLHNLAGAELSMDAAKPRLKFSSIASSGP